MKKWFITGVVWSLWSVFLLVLFDFAVIDRWFYYWVDLGGLPVRNFLPFYPTNITNKILMDGFSLSVPGEYIRYIYSSTIFVFGIIVFGLIGYIFECFNQGVVRWKWILSIYNVKNILFVIGSISCVSVLRVIGDDFDYAAAVIIILFLISIISIFGFAGKKVLSSNKLYCFNWKWIGFRRFALLVLSMIVIAIIDYGIDFLCDELNIILVIAVEFLCILINALEIVLLLSIILDDKFELTSFYGKYCNKKYVLSFLQLEIIGGIIISFLIIPFVLASVYLIYFIPQIAEFSREVGGLPVYVKKYLELMDFFIENWFLILPVPAILLAYKQSCMIFVEVAETSGDNVSDDL